MSDFFLIASSRIKYAADSKPYTVDLKRYLRSYWIKGRAYNLGDFVRSPTISGFAYQAMNAGEAGNTEPPWPRVLGGTVQDGSITWQSVLPALNALDAITSVAWNQLSPPDSQLTIIAPVNTNEEATARFVGGTAGQVYRIQCAATTFAANLYTTEFDLEIA